MKNQFSLHLIGAAFMLLLVSTLSSCTTPDGYTHYPLGIGANCAVNGFPTFPGSPAPCMTGGQPVMYQEPGCYGSGYGAGQYPQQGYGPRIGYQRQPLQRAGQDAYGNSLYSGRSFSGHQYLTSNGYVNPPPIQAQNPYGQLRYVYFNSPDRRSDPGPNGQPPVW